MTRTKFDNIKKLPLSQICDGMKYCYENSNELFESAQILYTSKKYGVALSILTLSFEEMIKAFSLFSMLITDDTNYEDIRDIFESKNLHKSRHDHALLFDEILKTGNMEEFLRMNINSEITEDFANSVVKNIDIPKAAISADNEKKNHKNWFTQANDKKNTGLYVSYNNSWQYPKKITEADYNQAIEATEKIRSFVALVIGSIADMDSKEFIELISDNKESLSMVKNKMNSL